MSLAGAAAMLFHVGFGFMGALWSTESLRVYLSMQTRCIVNGEAQKSPFLWRFSGSF